MTGAEIMPGLAPQGSAKGSTGRGAGHGFADADFERLRSAWKREPEGLEYQRAFSALVEVYRDRIFRLALSVLGPAGAAEAEDVTQEVFLTVFRKLHTFRSESRFSTWLYRIAYRRAIDVRRRARFRLPHTTDEVLATLPAAAQLPVEQRIRLYAAVEALGERRRSVLYLHYWLGETVDDIATLLRCRPGTVKSQLHRARAQLGRLLGAGPHEETRS